LESVYGSEAEEIPEALLPASLLSEGKDKAKATNAALNMLNLDEGYSDSTGIWNEEAELSTRMGEASVRIRLAKSTGETLKPWHENGTHAWEMSEIRVYESMVTSPEKLIDKKSKALYEYIKSSMPDQCRWSILIPLSLSDQGNWIGKAINKKGEEVTLVYSSLTGLRTI
jgi:CRISPR-associated endonuclease/helicase Cas3